MYEPFGLEIVALGQAVLCTRKKNKKIMIMITASNTNITVNSIVNTYNINNSTHVRATAHHGSPLREHLKEFKYLSEITLQSHLL